MTLVRDAAAQIDSHRGRGNSFSTLSALRLRHPTAWVPYFIRLGTPTFDDLPANSRQLCIQRKQTNTKHAAACRKSQPPPTPSLCGALGSTASDLALRSLRYVALSSHISCPTLLGIP